MIFENRFQAGLFLANELNKRKIITASDRREAVVFGIDHGGVVVAKGVSSKFKIPLGVLVVKKIGAPSDPELALGAVSAGKTLVLDSDLVKSLGVEKDYLGELVREKQSEVSRKMAKYGKNWKMPALIGKIIILVDDGIATGATMEVAIKYLRNKKIKKLILAVPVAARDSFDELSKLADETVVLDTPEHFNAVGEFYRDFPQVTDEEVIQLLQK